MQTIQVGKFKNDFSNILKSVQLNGETFIIEYGKKHQKVAMLVPYEEKPPQKRTFNPYKNKGSFKFHDNFEINEEEFLGK
jgi:antitoxin (DNA-binding transcriptional repressor) of toxin-antitoxin stability system